jgi:hypothetical protein
MTGLKFQIPEIKSQTIFKTEKNQTGTWNRESKRTALSGFNCNKCNPFVVTNSLEIIWSSKITEGGFSYPPYIECRGLENPRSFEEEIHRDYYVPISNAARHVVGFFSSFGIWRLLGCWNLELGVSSNAVLYRLRFPEYCTAHLK